MNKILLLVIFTGMAARVAAVEPDKSASSGTVENKEIQTYISAMDDYRAALKTANEDVEHFAVGIHSIPEGERIVAKAEARAQLRSSLKLMTGKLEIARAALMSYLANAKNDSEEIFKAEDNLADIIVEMSSVPVTIAHGASPAIVEQRKIMLSQLKESQGRLAAGKKRLSDVTVKINAVVVEVEERIKRHTQEVERIK